MTAIATTEIATLTKSQARKLCDLIKQQAVDLQCQLRRLRDGQGWLALGYVSWEKCVAVEFGYSKRHADRLIETETKRELLGQNCPKDLPDSHVVELFDVPKEARDEVYKAAVETSGGKPTAKDIREAAEALTVTPDPITPEIVDDEPEDADDEPDKEAESDKHAYILAEAEVIADECGNRGAVKELLGDIADVLRDLGANEIPLFAVKLQNYAESVGRKAKR